MLTSLLPTLAAFPAEHIHREGSEDSPPSSLMLSNMSRVLKAPRFQNPYTMGTQRVWDRSRGYRKDVGAISTGVNGGQATETTKMMQMIQGDRRGTSAFIPQRVKLT